MHTLEKLIMILWEAPVHMKIDIFLCGIFFLGGFIAVIVFPMVFMFFVYPKVEKRLGMKLKNWGYLADMNLFGNFFMSYSIFYTWVFAQMFILKFSKDPDASIKKWNMKRAWKCDLSKANYDVRDASKFEKRISILAAINIFIVTIDMIIFYFLRMY